MLVSLVATGGPTVYPVHMSWIDVAVASLVVIATLRGWSQGLLRQLGSFLGRVLGLVGGCYLAVEVAPHIRDTVWRPLDVILIIGVSTVAGGLLLRYFGGVFSARLRESRLGLADSGLGAAVGAVGMLVTCWFVAVLLSVVPWSSVGRSINKSVILRYVQQVLPSPPAVEGRLQAVLSEVNVPSLFSNVVAPLLSGKPPRLLATVHHVSSPSAVEPVFAWGGCDGDTSGTGFAVAPDEVVTTAHLLAGQSSVVVAGRSATVVGYDPSSDLAVLRVVGLNVSPLGVSSSPATRSSAQVVGYPTPNDRARSDAYVLGQVRAPGRDIYSGPVFLRTMDVVAAPLDPAESGAPVLVDGQVAAVIVERAVADTDLDYAVPASQLRQDLAGVTSRAVSTQRCLS